MHVEQQPAAGASAATGGASYTWHNGLSRDSQTLVVILSSAALAIALVALVMMQWSLASHREHTKELIEAVEKRAMDQVWKAEREFRIAQEKVDRLEVGLGKRGININTDGH